MMRDKRFEEWFAEYANLELSYVEIMWTGATYSHYKYTVEVAWAAWCASRMGSKKS